jgi:hypothetical protein
VLAAADGRRAHTDCALHLDRALALMHEVGAVAYGPQIHRARAECARAAGQEAEAQAQLAEAQRLLSEMSAAASARAEPAAPSAD